MKLRYVIPSVLFVVFAVALIAKNYKPMQLRPVNQQLAGEIRQLQAGDLMVYGSGEVSTVIRQLGTNKIELRNIRDTRYEADIDTLARFKTPVRLVHQGNAEWQSCAAAYIKKERCQLNR